MKGLTRRQSEILQYIYNFIVDYQYSPSYREIQKHFGFSSLGTVYSHLKALKEKGNIDYDKQRRRSIIPAGGRPKRLSGIASVPLAGKITARQPIELFPNPTNIDIPGTLASSSDNVYALRIVGDGFSEELIGDGDIIIIQAQQGSFEGETAVIKINDSETAIKKVFYEDGFVRLEGQAAYHQPMILRRDDIMIMGIIIGLIRSFAH